MGCPVAKRALLPLPRCSGLDREDLQRALGVKPMDKSSK